MLARVRMNDLRKAEEGGDSRAVSSRLSLIIVSRQNRAVAGSFLRLLLFGIVDYTISQAPYRKVL